MSGVAPHYAWAGPQASDRSPPPPFRELTMGRRSVLVVLFLIAPVACADRGGDAVASASAIPLYTDLGDHSYSVTTSEPRAQQYFDQGLRLAYAFNHGEAVRAFDEAARLDPACAMCAW